MKLHLKRPRILARAARAGARIYKRERDLASVAPRLTIATRSDKALVSELAAEEAACEADRKNGAATYSTQRHVSLLSALLAEARRIASVTQKNPAQTLCVPQ
ncbi:MAG: DUF6477 family protein [Pikeienuella sp.]